MTEQASAAPPGREFLSVSEAAQRIGVSRDAGYRLVNRGGMPHIRINGRLRVPVRALEAWLTSRANEALANSSKEADRT